ncbi:MAG: asparagine synthase-related protein [Chloroflexota bacterium]
MAIHDTLYFDRVARRRLFAKPMNEALKGVHPEAYKIPLQSGIDHVDRMTRSDFFSYLVDDILVKVDRASMAVSLETRAPWLDKAIMEFAFGRVPSNLKATTTERKRLLRLLGQKLLPDSLDLTRKQGFSLPLGSWFKGSWGTALTDMLSDADPALFNQAEITNLVAGQRRGYDNSSRLFALTMFELWRREYQIRL